MRTRRTAPPAYLVAHRSGQKRYRVVVHGQDARVVIGHAPFSITKIELVVLGTIVVIAMLVAIAVLVGSRR